MRTLCIHPKPVLTAIVASGLSLLASACFFTPGHFEAALDLERNHDFAFHYSGEIVMIPLREEEEKASRPFTPEPCHDESYEERACSSAEVADQKQAWAERKARDAAAARALLGGIDPADPQAGVEMAAQLQRREGWNRVEYRGHGTFDVDYTTQGRLDRDFVFPTFEGFAMANAFVQVLVRKDGTVRMLAPGFGPDASGAAAASMIPSLPLASEPGNGPSSLADGTFTLRTDGAILVNNTQEGPAKVGPDQVLTWRVGPAGTSAPTALIRLVP